MVKTELPPAAEGDNDRNGTEEAAAPQSAPRKGGGEGMLSCPACGAYAYRHDRYCACCGTPLYPCEPRDRHPVAFFCTQCGGGLDRERE